MENSDNENSSSEYKVFHDSFYKTYQKDAANITQLYDLFHKAARDVLIAHVELNFKDKKELKILDVGPGAGKELETLLPALTDLNKKVSIDLVDFNQQVINDLKQDISINKKFGDLGENLFFNYFGGKENGDINKFDFSDKCYDIVFSSFTLHHLEDREKLNFYRNAFDSLVEYGFLIVLDLMKFHSDFISKFAAEQEYGWILNNLLANDIAKIDDTDIDFDKVSLIISENFNRDYIRLINFEKLEKEIKSFAKDEDREFSYLNFYKNTLDWIIHYEKENKLAPVEWQVELINSLGFREVSTPFKHWQNVLLVAKK